MPQSVSCHQWVSEYTYSMYGGFLKWGTPNHPKSIPFLYWNPWCWGTPILGSLRIYPYIIIFIYVTSRQAIYHSSDKTAMLYTCWPKVSRWRGSTRRGNTMTRFLKFLCRLIVPYPYTARIWKTQPVYTIIIFFSPSNLLYHLFVSTKCLHMLKEQAVCTVSAHPYDSWNIIP